MISEFKAFAMRGNVVDLAVGVIIGAAFGKVVSSFVNDVLMPPIGLAVGGVNFTGLKVALREGAGDVPAVTLNYGAFIQNVVDFLIIAFAVFLVVRAFNAMQRRPEPAPAAPLPPPEDVVLLREIRDLLRTR
jgi:large conductance mechanosensitive channel